MRVLVMGAGGFIGRNVSIELKKAGDEVFYGSRQPLPGVDEAHHCLVDLLDPKMVGDAVDRVKPNAIVNCAAVIDPFRKVDNNPIFTRNIIEAVASSDQKVDRIIVCGSAAEYGLVANGEIPVSENTPLRAESPYALSKKAEEETALELGAKYGLSVTVARIFNPIGSGMSSRSLVANILVQVDEFKRGVRANLEVNRLDSRRDYMSVHDVGTAIKILVHSKPRESVYNIGSGVTTSNAKIVELILDNLHIILKPTVKEIASVPESPIASQADITRMSEEFGWHPRITLEESIREVIDNANNQ